jgi:hypothetical protein
MESTMNHLKLQDQRFMVSPCGRYAETFEVHEIADKARGWTDCTDISEIEALQLMERRMLAADRRRRESRDEDRADRAQWSRDYDLCRI